MEQKKGFKAFLCTGAGRIGMILVLYAVIFLLALLILNAFDGSEYLMFGLIAIFAFFGWKALNKITPDIFLFMPLIGWFIYFFIKLLLSAAVGIFAAPFVISRKITDAIQKSLNEEEK